MDRKEYIKRVMPIIKELGEEKADIVLDKIAAYLVDAGEENEAAALNALGIPELFARKFIHSGGEYEIPPFSGDPRKQSAAKPKQQEKQESTKIIENTEEMPPTETVTAAAATTQPKYTPTQPKYSPQQPKTEAASRQASKADNKKAIIVLAILVLTSPLWLGFMAIFCAIALVFVIAVVIMLLVMTVGGAALTVFGIIRIVSLLPVGLIMIGAGLLLLGLSGIAFIPLLNVCLNTLSDTVRDIRVFVKRVISIAFESKAEVSR